MVQLVVAFVLSRIDYCNAVLAALPQSTIEPLQRATCFWSAVLRPHHSSPGAVTLVAGADPHQIQTAC